MEFLKENNKDFENIEISGANIHTHHDNSIESDDIIDTEYSNTVKASQDGYVGKETMEPGIDPRQGIDLEDIEVQMTGSMMEPDSIEGEAEIGARALGSLVPEFLLSIPGGKKLSATFHDFGIIRKIGWDVFPYGVGDYEDARTCGMTILQNLRCH